MSVEKKNAYIGVDLGGTNMRAGRIAVSYTHLTLPTICSV